MPLPKELLAQLVAGNNTPQKRGRKKKSGIDTSVRDVQTWFKLGHKLFDEDDPDKYSLCDNPNCPDPRPAQGKRTVVAEVEGVRMCRFCFLAGWRLITEEQLTIE